MTYAGEELYRRAEKQPLTDDRPTATLLDRAAVQALIPHRDPFLLVDRVTRVDREANVIVARYDLGRARDILGGHFPARPMYPGVLHVEAVGQAGMILGLHGGEDRPDSIAMTHVRAARFVRPVGATGELEIVACVFEDGLFFNVVGQCLYDGEVCSAVALSALP